MKGNLSINSPWFAYNYELEGKEAYGRQQAFSFKKTAVDFIRSLEQINENKYKKYSGGGGHGQ